MVRIFKHIFKKLYQNSARLFTIFTRYCFAEIVCDGTFFKGKESFRSAHFRIVDDEEAGTELGIDLEHSSESWAINV